MGERVDDRGDDVDPEERDRQERKAAVKLDRQEARPAGGLRPSDREQPQAGDDAEEDEGDDAGAAGGEPQDLGAHELGAPVSGFEIICADRDEPIMRAGTFRSGYAPATAPASRDARSFAGSGQPFSLVTVPSSATSRAGRRAASSQVMAPAPMTIAAVAAVLASTHVGAATVAVRHGESTEPPVRGSIR